MPSFTGTIALSTGGLGKSIVGQFFTSVGAQLNIASVGVPPPVALSTYGNGWSSFPTTPVPEITAPNTLQVLTGYTTNSNTSVNDGVLSASITLDASNTSFNLYFRTTANQTSVGIIEFSYATPGSNVLTVTYIENSGYVAYNTGTATGPAVAPGTPFTGAVTFNGTATTVTINGTASGSFTAKYVTDAITGVCGVGSNQNAVGSVQCGSFLLKSTAGATVFSDNFPYSLSVQPVTISVNGGAAINLPSPTWAVPQPGFTIPAPYVFWPLPQYDTHTLFYGSALYTNDSRSNLVGLGGGTGGYSGSYGIAYAPTSAQIAAYNRQNEGLFPFQGLLPAAWTINATWPASASNSTAVTVTVLSGSSGVNAVNGGASAAFTASAITGAGVCGLLNVGSGASQRDVSSFSGGTFSDSFPTPEALSTYGNGWTVEATTGGTPTVTYPNTLSMGTGTGASLATNAGASFTNGTVAATFHLGAGAGVGLVFRYASATSYAYVQIEYTTGNATALSYWEANGGAAAQVGNSVTGPSLFYNQPVTLSVTTNGTAISVTTSNQNYSLDGTGATLATFTINQTLAPTGGPTINGVVFQTLGSVTTTESPGGLTVVFSNSGTTGQVVFDAVSIAPTSAVSTIIKNTDVVTLSCPTSGWASFADGSYAPVLTNAAVTNKVGGFNFTPVDPAAAQTMAIGVNVDGDYDYTIVPFQANFAKRSGVYNSDTVLTASDPVTQYPTIIKGVGVVYPSGITLAATAGTGIVAAGTYEYQVASNNTHGTSPASPAVSITTTATGEITISWGAVTGATSYNVYGRSAGSIALIASGLTGTTYTDTGTVAPSGALPTSPTVFTTPLIQINQRRADGKTLPIAPLGDYTLMWNGTVNLTISSGDHSTSEITADAVITGTTNNTRVYTVADVGQISPGFNVNITSSAGRSDGDWNCDLADFRLFPPGVDAANPPYVSPWYAPTVYGSCIRVMQGIGTNDSPIVKFSDMTPDNAFSAYGNYTPTVPIASVGPGDYTRCFFPSPVDYPTHITYPILFTTSTPHGFTAGQTVNINGSPGSIVLIYDNPPGQTGTQTVDVSNYFGTVDVVNSTQFQIINFQYNGGPIQNTITPTGSTASVNYLTTGMTLVGTVEAANAANADLWRNIHLLADDDNVTQVAQYIAANLAPGKKWYLEYSNETWNGAFFQNNTCIYLTNQLQGSHTGQDYTYFYVKRMAEVQALALTAWTAAGRSAGSLVRVLGSQYSSPGRTQGLADQMKAQGVTADVLAVAPYMLNEVIGTPSLQPIFDVLSVDQLSELFDITLLWSPRYTQQHLAALAADGFTNIKAVAYEGSIQEGVPNNDNGNVQTANAHTRDYAVFHHPRMFQQTLFNLAQDQASGITLYNMFINSGPSYPGGMWPALQSYIPNPGTGSMTADAANLTSPLAFSGTAVKDEVWGAYKHWSTVAPNTSGQALVNALNFFEFLFFHDRNGSSGGGGGFLSMGI